ncbi:MAG: hypothetical protein WD669_01020 [Pirellulales bacterium]
MPDLDQLGSFYLGRRHDLAIGKTLAEPPAEPGREKSYPIFTRQLKEHLYREESLKLWRCPVLGETSRGDESNDDFRARLAPLAAQRLAGQREKIRQQYAGKLADVEAAVKRHEVGLRTQRWQSWASWANILWVIAERVLCAMGHGRRGRPRAEEVAIRRAATEHGQQTTAQLGVKHATQEKQRLEKELQDKLQSLDAQFDLSKLEIEPLSVPPRKGDVDVNEVSLIWLPWRVDAAGRAEPVY